MTIAARPCTCNNPLGVDMGLSCPVHGSQFVKMELEALRKGGVRLTAQVADLRDTLADTRDALEMQKMIAAEGGKRLKAAEAALERLRRAAQKRLDLPNSRETADDLREVLKEGHA